MRCRSEDLHHNPRTNIGAQSVDFTGIRSIIEIKTGRAFLRCCGHRRNAIPKTFAVILAPKAIRVVPAVPLTGIVPGDVKQCPAISIGRRGSGSYVPPAQQERILHRHLMAESMRRISREEHRDFRTIAKVIRINPARLKEHLEQSRAQFYVLTTLALDTIQQAMATGDAEMAYRLLIDAGVVPKPGQIP